MFKVLSGRSDFREKYINNGNIGKGQNIVHEVIDSITK